MLFSIRISWKALNSKEGFNFIYDLSVYFASLRGTSFYKADLTEANFSKATLQSANFEEANLSKVFWAGARDLNRARVGYTYLQYSKIQGLVTTLKGQGQNFDRLYLEGINLKCADLQDTSFINTNLNNADLQKSDLSRAILKQTQLDGANLTGAIITGAYIEDWGITGETDLNNIRCEYVYMHVPTKMYPNPIRKPDNLQEIFTDGSNSKFRTILRHFSDLPKY